MFRGLLIFAILLGLNCATTNSGKKPGPDSDNTFTLDCSNTKSPYYISVMKGKGNFSITRFLEYSVPASAHQNFLSQNQKIWDKALLDYQARKFSEVKTLLEPFLSKYDQDLNLRELYAKSWYWSQQNRGKDDKLIAFYLDLYKRVHHEIDVQDGIRKKGEVVIVLGFNDIEWKIATIYLDRAEWQTAESYLELSLFGVTMTNDGNQAPHPSVIENYAYLTETAYYLNDKDKNRFYLCKTLQLNPKNTYALQFLLR